VKRYAPLLAALLLAACSKNIQTPEAVRSAVMEYLASRSTQTGLDMNAMQIEIGATTFEKDTAHVTVAISPKGNPGGGGMQMSYNLDRKGDKWVVRPGGTPHGMIAPQTPGTTPSGQALPPGHPPVGKQ
jgi:hypothetical protein